ncbi:MAG TPA: electron transfer flavoprotein subunit beta/FixA family protein [Gaiellaceae bacterium]|nr:electron transfer flavoprotein subunit beta/FixA family protein [Gaiellaceae bacterium]
MKLAVLVKEVPDASARTRIDPGSLRLDRSGPAALNPFDAHALEEALRIRERTGDGEVVAIMMAPARGAESLRKALAIGADRAVHVTDDALAGSDLVATARALAKAVEREEPDLVLLGQQGGDSDGAVLWSALADLLRLPVVSQASSLELAGGKATVKRQTEYGYDVIEAPLPAVVAVSDAINEPRYPSLKGIMGAKKKPFDTVDAAGLGLAAGEVGEAGSRTDVRALADPPSRGDSVRIEDDGSAAEKVVEYLAQRKLL